MYFEQNLREIEYFSDKDSHGCCDTLTGVLTREAMEGYVQWLIDNRHKFSFFLVDIDNFKNVNDTYGHVTGDAVLTMSAKMMIEACKGKGVVSRYGGDEFVIIYDGITEYQDVWNCANKLLHSEIEGYEAYGIPHLTITISAGISRFPIDATNYEDLLNIADKALYRGKNKGRHCFIIFLPEKHAHLLLRGERDKKQQLMQLCLGMFSSLTAYGEDIQKSISTVFKSFVSYFMFDHMCIETHEHINHNVVFPLAKQKNFSHIPYEMLKGIVNSSGYANVNDMSSLNETAFEGLRDECLSQNIKSALYCKISAYGKSYGFIRVDMTDTPRVWQNEEMSLVITAAKTIALLLHYQHVTLDELPLVDTIEAGSIE